MTPRKAAFHVLVPIVAAALAGTAYGQEIGGGATTTSKAMSSALPAVSAAMLEGAGNQANNWLHANGEYSNLRYSPGNQINATNVGKLRPAFVFQTAVM